jgi:small subunit ribosomal protein S9
MLNKNITIGRRKTAIAVAKIQEGEGKIFVNGKTLDDYFGNNLLQKSSAISPLVITGLKNKYDITLKVKGGGLTGQADAIKLAIARFLVSERPEFKTLLKQNEMLKRDPREVERKKPGQAKARKKFQWTKR